MHRPPEQLVLSDELQPSLPSTGVGAVRRTGAAARHNSTAHATQGRPSSVWAHEAGFHATSSATYKPALRRDPEWVARTLDAAQCGVIHLSAFDTAELARLLDEQIVYEAVTTIDLENGTQVTLQEKRRRGLALARQVRTDAQELHIPLCPSILAALTDHASSRWLIEELTHALQGELKPAIQQAESLNTLFSRLQA